MNYLRFFFVVSLFYLITITSSYSQFRDCIDIQGCVNGICNNCQNWSPATGYARTCACIVIPEYPTCSLCVRYCYRQCMDDARCVHFFWDYLTTSGNCTDFINGCSCPDPETRYQFGRLIENEIWMAIAKLNFNTFKNGIPANTWPYCDQPESTRYKVSGTFMSCRAYCFTQHPTTDPDVEMQITPLTCSGEFCCTRVMTFCVDRATGETITNEEWYSTPSTLCSGTPPSLNSCPAGENVAVSNCNNYCIQP
jgi:hypothetical protein